MSLDRPTLYRRVSSIEGQIEEKVVQTFSLEKQRDLLTEKDLEAMRKLQRVEVSIVSLKNGFQQMKSMLFEFRTQIEYKQQHTTEVERHIEEYQSQEAEIDAKVKALEAQANKSGEVFSEGDSEKLVAVNKMIDDLSHKLAIQEAERT
jgi:chromosome segregation ATPase